MASWPIYGTIAEHDAYHAAHGSPSAWTGATHSARVSALREASEFLDFTYSWSGYASTSTQVRRWPRVGAYTYDGYAIEGIPAAVKDATSYLALRVLQDDVLLPDVEAGQTEGSVRVLRQKLDTMEREVEYQGGATQSVAKRFPKVDQMLRAAGVLSDGLSLERG